MRLVALVLVTACGGETRTVREPPAPAVTIDRGIGAPPEGEILIVAVTDQGDAALTFDAGNALRLWPTLDGAYEPVVVTGPIASHLALARSGDGLLAIVRDDANGIELIELTRGGRVLGRARLPAEPGFDDVVPVTGGVIALGKDQRVSRFDAAGRLVGTVAAPAGEEVGELAARRDGVIAGISRDAWGEARVVAIRQLDLATMTWGHRRELPVPLVDLALSPDHRRLAGFDPDTQEAVLLDLGAQVRRVSGAFDKPSTGDPRRPPTVGFIDDGHAAIANAFSVAWSDNVQPSYPTGANSSLAAFGDGVVVIGHDEALVLVDRGFPDAQSRWRFLGYHDLGVGVVYPAGTNGSMGIGGSHVSWFDAKLEIVQRYEAEASHGIFDGTEHRFPEALDDRLVVETVRPPSDLASRQTPASTRVLVRSISPPLRELMLGAWVSPSLEFDPASRVLAIRSGRAVDRFSIAPDGKPTRLSTIHVGLRDASVVPIDPRTGVIAIAAARDFDRGRTTLEVISATGRPTTTTVPGNVLGIDDRATVWLADRRQLVVFRDGRTKATPIALTGDIAGGVPSPDGSLVALYTADELVVVDGEARERWRMPAVANGAAFTRDGRGILITTPNRLLRLDAASGALQGARCAWGFGVHVELAPNNGTVCTPPAP